MGGGVSTTGERRGRAFPLPARSNRGVTATATSGPPTSAAESRAAVDSNFDQRAGREEETAPSKRRVIRLLGSGRLRVTTLTFVLAAAALLVYWVFLHDVNSGRAVTNVPWPVFSLGFFLVEVKVVEVYFRRERHSFSLSEVPAVFGLFYLTPMQYLVAMMVGSGLALVVATEQSPLKIAFNLANSLFVGTLTLVTFTTLVGAGQMPTATVWIAISAAMILASVAGAVTIAAAITLSGGAPQFQKLPEMIRFAIVVAAANTSLSLLTLTAAARDPQAILLVVIPVIILFAAYRAYMSEREKHDRLELVYESSRIMQHSAELGLRRARRPATRPGNVPCRTSRGSALRGARRRRRAADCVQRRRAQRGDDPADGEPR